MKLSLGPSWKPHHKLAHTIQLMHVSNLKHEFKISPRILPQVLICAIHKVTELAPRDVVEIPWNKLQFKAFIKELPNVAMVLPLLLFHHPPPCGGIMTHSQLFKGLKCEHK